MFYHSNIKAVSPYGTAQRRGRHGSGKIAILIQRVLVFSRQISKGGKVYKAKLLRLKRAHGPITGAMHGPITGAIHGPITGAIHGPIYVGANTLAPACDAASSLAS